MAPLMKMAMVNAQNAGLKINPICSLVNWNALLIGPATSPRIANTMEVVTSDTQLATNSLCLGMQGSWRGGERYQWRAHDYSDGRLRAASYEYAA